MTVQSQEEYSFDQMDRQFLFNFSQYVLYCRGVYKVGNVYNDLKKVLSIISGKNVSDINNQDVFDVALKLFLCIYRRNDPNFLFQVVNPFMQGQTEVNHETYLLRLLRGISRAKITFPLQKANYNILPAAEPKA